jgi:hypothetical protein
MSMRDAIAPLAAVVAIVTGGGCTEPAPDASGDCTPATDVVPLDDIAWLAQQTVRIGDTAVARDGTVYFVSSRLPDRSTIGRRVTCGAIERAWLTVPALVNEIEISSDHQLYIAANTQAPSWAARLYRVSLDVEGAAPTMLVDKPDERIWSLSAGTGGRVFYVQAGTIYATSSTSQQPEELWRVPYDSVVIAAGAEGTVAVIRRDGYKIVAATLSGSPDETPTFRPVNDPWWIQEMRTDELGGIYGLRLGPEGMYQLVHAERVDGVREVISTVSADGSGGARMAYALDGSATSAMIVLGLSSTAPQHVELPVPVMIP